jgi:phosphatidylserine decarboxylase
MSALSFATAQLLRVLPRARISRAAGKLADHKWSAGVGRAVVGLYSRMYDVALDECEKQSGWESFDEFFTRGLRAGARPIEGDGSVVVSPSDGRLDCVGRVDTGCGFPVKGRLYGVEELVGDPVEARRYVGGIGCVVYLSPRDYHRVHAPVGGVVRRVLSMPGDYFPVNAVGVRHVPQLFVRNRRVAIFIDAPDGLGRVALVMVSAMIVGRITVTGVDAWDVPIGDHPMNMPIARGDELGMFHLGSTVALFLEKAAASEWLAPEGPIRLGRALSRGDVAHARANGAHQLRGNG